MPKAKVMVIDDEENIRSGIAEGIDWNSYELEITCQAANGREALALAEKHRPDIILLDINMPFMNGLEFSHKVKEFLPGCVLIVLTGYNEFEFAKESIQLGVSDYLLKPIAPADLIAAVVKARDKVVAEADHVKFINDLKRQIEQNMPLDLSSPFLVNYPYDKEIGMVNSLKACNGRAMEYLEDIFPVIEGQGDLSHLPDYFKVFSCQLFLAVLKLFASLGISHEDLRARYGYLLNYGPRAENIAYLKEELRDFINECQNSIIKSKGITYRKEIENVKNYIAKNYSRDISLKEISASVFMNTNYLCTVFKNEVGETINNYITKIRMEKAMELLHNPDLKIFEISAMVGYSNTNYFSFAFKKHTDISPNEYRLSL